MGARRDSSVAEKPFLRCASIVKPGFFFFQIEALPAVIAGQQSDKATGEGSCFTSKNNKKGFLQQSFGLLVRWTLYRCRL
jgi:hypothetical protein